MFTEFMTVRGSNKIVEAVFSIFSKKMKASIILGKSMSML